jgi:hypothetical protein
MNTSTQAVAGGTDRAGKDDLNAKSTWSPAKGCEPLRLIARSEHLPTIGGESNNGGFLQETGHAA